MPFVLDTSVTLAWAFADEQTPYALAVLNQLQADRAHVPSVWPLEVVNVLVVGERRNRLTLPGTAQFIQTLETLGIVVDPASFDRAAHAVLPLARSHNLSAYDASYLELAVRLGLPLATQDNRLIAVATQLGIPILAPGALDPSFPNGA
jgi:predicted nucleic acid-binding protein